MPAIDLDQAIAYINQSGRGHFVGPQPEERIARAERRLGLRFPPTYREFLSRLGCGDMDGEEFYGVIADDFEDSGVPDAIWVTMKRRRSVSIPAQLVIVGATGDGGDFVIDTSRRDARGECPVLEWWSDTPEGHCRVALDFGEFFWNSIRR